MKIFLAGASGVIGRHLVPRLAGLRGAANSRARKDYGWQPIHPSWREGFRTALG